MHDPMVIIFDIRRPWPKRFRTRRNDRRWYWRWGSAFATLAGREFYFPTLITVWHVEPHGADALLGECRGTRWRWHVHHYHIQWCFLQDWRRWWLTRRQWCGGKSRKSDMVNHSYGDRCKSAPWWRGENDLYHSDCMTVHSAHRMCLCADPVLDHTGYGQCAFCGKFRDWRCEPTIPDRYLASLPTGSRIPADKQDWLNAEWAKLRAKYEPVVDA